MTMIFLLILLGPPQCYNQWPFKRSGPALNFQSQAIIEFFSISSTCTCPPVDRGIVSPTACDNDHMEIISKFNVDPGCDELALTCPAAGGMSPFADTYFVSRTHFNAAFLCSFRL
ncbi:hypothetical protein BDR07DRAFT_212887 [Suillus spraguei]|nr:hypothetical protein BDR07DRAFT_212887 [Suillus spraguei]